MIDRLSAGSCHPMLEFAGFMPDFAVPYSLKCQSLLSVLRDSFTHYDPPDRTLA
jgi:hypothetical protein